jgi:formylglycine-generating enzyme required for sulfatase activity
VRWFRRRSEGEPSQSAEKPAEESFEIGGDRIVFWKAKSEMVDGEIYGPVWIADATDPNVTLEEPDEWVTWEQAEEFARRRGLPIEDV